MCRMSVSCSKVNVGFPLAGFLGARRGWLAVAAVAAALHHAAAGRAPPALRAVVSVVAVVSIVPVVSLVPVMSLVPVVSLRVQIRRALARPRLAGQAPRCAGVQRVMVHALGRIRTKRRGVRVVRRRPIGTATPLNAPRLFYNRVQSHMSTYPAGIRRIILFEGWALATFVAVAAEI